MAKSPKSHLLEELRAQAESVSAKRVRAQEVSIEVLERIDRRMHAIFQYFDEASKLLQIIGSPIERSFTLAEAAAALEAFNTSAVALVAPVVELDGKPFGSGKPGPVTRSVQRLYYQAIGADVARAAPWLVD